MKRDPVWLSGKLKTVVPQWCLGVGALGLAGCALLFKIDPHHFSFSYLTAYMYFLSITLGSLFFVIIQHLVRAGWSVAIRRIPETLAMNVGWMALLFIPIVIAMPELYHWTHADALAHDHLLQWKAPYLNVPFFLLRAGFFFVVWVGLAWLFYSRSVKQDTSHDGAITLRLQGLAAVAILLFGLTQTFASFDWLMSVTPHWYSTMFGVCFFAGSVLSALSLTVLILLTLRRARLLYQWLRIDHLHDLSKLIYGFNVFWAYVTFSQYFLYWYANIPEESMWFMAHFKGSWQWVGVFITLGHFFIPFVVFMSKHMRRNLKVQVVMMLWFLFMHAVEMVWLVMPNASPAGFHLGIGDVVAFVGIGGVYMGLFWRRLAKHSLVPVGDPRLPESMHYHT